MMTFLLILSHYFCGFRGKQNNVPTLAMFAGQDETVDPEVDSVRWDGHADRVATISRPWWPKWSTIKGHLLSSKCILGLTKFA